MTIVSRLRSTLNCCEFVKICRLRILLTRNWKVISERLGDCCSYRVLAEICTFFLGICCVHKIIVLSHTAVAQCIGHVLNSRQRFDQFDSSTPMDTRFNYCRRGCSGRCMCHFVQRKRSIYRRWNVKHGCHY